MAMALLAAASTSALAAQPNPPKWPSSVQIFGPSDAEKAQSAIHAAFATNGGHSPSNHGQFSDKRFAFLFKPGTYDVDAPVGYYTQVLGLGAKASDVTFTSSKGVYCQEGDFSIGGALSTFWRSAENFRTLANNTWNVGTGMMWAVSQAAPLRRVEIENDLCLFEYEPPIPAAGEASGGYFANLKVGGKISVGSQQQWFARDSTIGNGKWDGGVWNIVTTGVVGANPSHCSDTTPGPFTTVDATPTVSEKPYITIDPTSGKFSLEVPPVKTNSKGYVEVSSGGTSIPFEQVYVTDPSDSAAVINAQLAAGLHVVITPGIYHLEAPLSVSTSNQVILGLGLATLIAAKQTAAIEVTGNVDGVRIAGLLLQAGAPAAGVTTGATGRSPALLRWGGANSTYGGSAASPGFLQDIFARVGGPDGSVASPVAAESMVEINAGHVVGDNFWLWRADHSAAGAVTYETNQVSNGLVVNGDDVTIYGLAVEHTLKDLTLWNGERGRTYFYQSELPYIVTREEYETPGYVSYRVGANVKAHNAWGIGVYTNFVNDAVLVKSGIVCPAAVEKNFIAPLCVKLAQLGGLSHVINDKGAPCTGNKTTVSYVC